MQDLRNMMGMAALPVQIEVRQLAYLGHIGRYPDTRLERQLLNVWLSCDGESPPKVAMANRCTRRGRCADLICKVYEKTGADMTNWQTGWIDLARRGKETGALWRRTTMEIKEDLEVRAQQQTWEASHAADEEPTHLTAVPVAPAFYECPKCQSVQHRSFFAGTFVSAMANNLRVHLEATSPLWSAISVGSTSETLALICVSVKAASSRELILCLFPLHLPLLLLSRILCHQRRDRASD